MAAKKPVVVGRVVVKKELVPGPERVVEKERVVVPDVSVNVPPEALAPLRDTIDALVGELRARAEADDGRPESAPAAPAAALPDFEVRSNRIRLKKADGEWSEWLSPGGGGGGGIPDFLVGGGRLKVTAKRMYGRSAFGEAEIAERIPQGHIAFVASSLNELRVTPASSGTGATGVLAAGLGEAKVGNGNGTASITSIKKKRYRPGFGLWDRFTVVFPDLALLTDAEVGLFRQNNGVTTFVPRSAWLDPLQAHSGSRYTLNGSPVVADFTKGQVVDIAGGWLGFSPHALSFQRPDSMLADEDAAFAVAHAFSPVNAESVPVTRNPDLPMRVSVSRTDGQVVAMIGGHDGTNGTGLYVRGTYTGPNDFRVHTASWSFGLSGSAAQLDRAELNDNEHVEATTSVAGGAAPVSQLVYDVPAGQTLSVYYLSGSVANALSSGGEITLTDGSGGPVRYRKRIPVAAGITQAILDFDSTLPEPITFTDSVWVNVAAVGTAGGAAINLTGTFARTRT